MNMAALLLGLVVVGTTLYLVVRPLLESTPDDGTAEAELDREEALRREKESVFTTLGEIEFDYQMKKLSPDDYQALQSMYKREAVSVLKAEESVKTAAVEIDKALLEAEVEREIEDEIKAELERKDGKKNDAAAQ